MSYSARASVRRASRRRSRARRARHRPWPRARPRPATRSDVGTAGDGEPGGKRDAEHAEGQDRLGCRDRDPGREAGRHLDRGPGTSRTSIHAGPPTPGGNPRRAAARGRRRRAARSRRSPRRPVRFGGAAAGSSDTVGLTLKPNAAGSCSPCVPRSPARGTAAPRRRPRRPARHRPPASAGCHAADERRGEEEARSCREDDERRGRVPGGRDRGQDGQPEESASPDRHVGIEPGGPHDQHQQVRQQRVEDQRAEATGGEVVAGDGADAVARSRRPPRRCGRCPLGGPGASRPSAPIGIARRHQQRLGQPDAADQDRPEPGHDRRARVARRWSRARCSATAIRTRWRATWTPGQATKLPTPGTPLVKKSRVPNTTDEHERAPARTTPGASACRRATRASRGPGPRAIRCARRRDAG